MNLQFDPGAILGSCQSTAHDFAFLYNTMPIYLSLLFNLLELFPCMIICYMLQALLVRSLHVARIKFFSGEVLSSLDSCWMRLVFVLIED